METNWCFPNKKKTLNEEQKIDANNKTKENILREKEKETASSRLNEEQKMMKIIMWNLIGVFLKKEKH